MEFIIKLILSGISIMIAAFLTPGMSVTNFTAAIVAAIVIAILSWAVGNFTSIDTNSKSRGLTGFLLTAFIIYITGNIVEGFNVGLFGAIIGAFVMGIVDAIIPREKRL